MKNKRWLTARQIPADEIFVVLKPLQLDGVAYATGDIFPREKVESRRLRQLFNHRFIVKAEYAEANGIDIRWDSAATEAASVPGLVEPPADPPAEEPQPADPPAEEPQADASPRRGRRG